MTVQLVDPVVGDPVLIARARAGSAEAYAELFERHRSAAVAFARRLAGPNHADDLVAEAFAKVLDALRRDLGPTVSFRSYLLTSIRSLWANTVRSEVRYDLVPDYETVPAPSGALSFSDDPDARFDNQAVAEAFRALPERWQAVLWYTAVEGLPHAEIATLLGIKANAVAALSFRAREGLREAYLSQHLGGTDDALCQAMVPLLPAYARGRLDKRKVPALEAHLDTCASCTAALADVDDVNNRLGALLLPIVLGAAAARSGWPFEVDSSDATAHAGQAAHAAHAGTGTGATGTAVQAATLVEAALGATTGGGAVLTHGARAVRVGRMSVAAKTGLLAVVATAAVASPFAGDMPRPIRDAIRHSPLAAAPGPGIGEHGVPGSSLLLGQQRGSHRPRAAGNPPAAPTTPVAPATSTPTSAPSTTPSTPTPTAPAPTSVWMPPASPSTPPSDGPSSGPTGGSAGGATGGPTGGPTGGVAPGDAGVGSISVSKVSIGGQTAARLTIPFSNAAPGAQATIVVSDLVGMPVRVSSGWRCPGTRPTLPTGGAATSTTLNCTYTGTAATAPPLVLLVLTSGPSTVTATVAPPFGVTDPNPANNSSTATIQP